MASEKSFVADNENTPVSPYAGRWVARVRGRIIAQGGTPEQALHAAQISRHKERPEIIYMPVPFSYSPLIDKVRDVLPDQEMYLVGGAVRDILLNRSSRDLDFALPSNGISSARRVANALKADFMALDHERDTGRVIVTSQTAHVRFWILPLIAGTTWKKICMPAISPSTPLRLTCTAKP